MSPRDIRGYVLRALERSDMRFGESYFVRSMATELQCPELVKADESIGC